VAEGRDMRCGRGPVKRQGRGRLQRERGGIKIVDGLGPGGTGEGVEWGLN